MGRAFLFLVLCSCGGARLVVPMQAENNSGQSGTATLEDTAQGLRVDVVVKAIDEPGSQPVHFHRGQCGEISAKVLTLTDDSMGNELVLAFVQELDGGVVGSLNTLAGQKLDQFTDGSWVINVHDPRDNALYTSCGNIR
jgi:hypothetical protein